MNVLTFLNALLTRRQKLTVIVTPTGNFLDISHLIRGRVITLSFLGSYR